MKGLTTEEFLALTGVPTDEPTGRALLAAGRVELTDETETMVFFKPTELGIAAVRIYARWMGRE